MSAETSPSAAERRLARHSAFEDAQALVTGTLLVSLGVAFLGKAGLVTGGTAGIDRKSVV